MGAKPTRTGQPLFLYTAGLLIWVLMVTGCLHWPPPSQGKQQLLEARQRLVSGDYSGALDISRHVQTQFPTSLAAQSLFQIGQIYAHPHNPDRDVQKAMAAFRDIIDHYPASSLRPEAELWLTLLHDLRAQEAQIHALTQRHAPLEKKIKMQHQKILRLQDQLEKLKRIDIKIEEKKRDTIPQTEDFEAKEDGKNSGS